MAPAHTSPSGLDLQNAKSERLLLEKQHARDVFCLKGTNVGKVGYAVKQRHVCYVLNIIYVKSVC